jgi:hypothetical protein
MSVAGRFGAAGDAARTLAAPSAVGALYALPTLIETTPRVPSALTAESSAYPIEPSVEVSPPMTPVVP